jgi:hypothetical protein
MEIEKDQKEGSDDTQNCTCALEWHLLIYIIRNTTLAALRGMNCG